MINKMLNTILLLSICIFISCSENITNPEPEPGRRDYVWTVDTINIVYPMHKIWGSSPTDVWAINESDFYHSIWHYDGNSWSTDSIFRFILPHALWGFSGNNVLIGGQRQIWQFDGGSWNKFAEISKEGTDFVFFENIWGESFNDFYAFGNGPDDRLLANHTVIVHFNKNQWTTINTDNLIGNVLHLYKNKNDNKIYFKLTKIGGGEFSDSTIIYEYKSGNYKKLYTGIRSSNQFGDVSLIDDKVYFILGKKIAERRDNQFQTFLNVGENFNYGVWGRSSKDIFLLMRDGVAHYNGDDLEYLFNFTYANEKPLTLILGAALFKEEIFFTIYEPPTDLKLIYHGKIKNGG